MTKKKPQVRFALCDVFKKPYKEQFCKHRCGRTPCKIYKLTPAQEREMLRELNEG